MVSNQLQTSTVWFNDGSYTKWKLLMGRTPWRVLIQCSKLNQKSSQSCCLESQAINIKLKKGFRKVPGPPPKLSALGWRTGGNLKHCTNYVWVMGKLQGIDPLIQGTGKQGKSEGFESCDRPIVRKRPIWVKIGDVLSRVTLKFDGWPWKTIGHLSFAVSSFVQHFIAIGEFQLELQSGNAQFGWN